VKYKGVVSSLIKIWVEEGPIGYFRGNGTNIIRIFPYSAVQFASYERYKQALQIWYKHQELSPVQNLYAGSLAGITCVIVTYPLDIIRTRLSVQSIDNIKYKGITHGLGIMVKQEGIFSLYKGISASILGIAPYVGINFMTYEILKKIVKVKIQPDPTTIQLLICGGIAGAAGQTITYPLDVLRRRMQMQGFNPDHPSYKHTWNAVQDMWRTGGYRPFFRGMVPNYLKVIPSISISFVVYEKTKNLIGA